MKTAFIATLLAVLGVIGFAGQHLQAGTISDTDSFTGRLTELANQPLRVDLFDAALGTLTQVSVTISGALRSAGEVTNTAAQAQSFTVSTRAQQYDGTLVAAGPSALPSSFEVFAAFDLIGSQTYDNLAPATPALFGPVSASKGPLTVLSTSDASELADFVGAGQFGYDFTTLILTTFAGGGGNVVTSIATEADATLTVTYDFAPTQVQPVPEPATLGLMAMGMAGLFYIRRRLAQQ